MRKLIKEDMVNSDIREATLRGVRRGLQIAYSPDISDMKRIRESVLSRNFMAEAFGAVGYHLQEASMAWERENNL